MILIKKTLFVVPASMFKNSKHNKLINGIVLMKRYGLHFPNLVSVLSIKHPAITLVIASTLLPSNNKTPAVLRLTPAISV